MQPDILKLGMKALSDPWFSLTDRQISKIDKAMTLLIQKLESVFRMRVEVSFSYGSLLLNFVYQMMKTKGHQICFSSKLCEKLVKRLSFENDDRYEVNVLNEKRKKELLR